MLEIRGNVNTAVCYAKTVEEEAAAQIKRMCDYALTEGNCIRIMPDVHAGKGCTIGTTMTINGRACPNVVGVDIGCGMYTVKLAEKELDLERMDEAAHEIPSGRQVWEGRKERFDLSSLRCYRSLKDTKRLERSLGTLGGGNHFIEVDRSSTGELYLVIHSGSRNLGKQVAEFYQQLAVDLHMGKEDYFRRREELIRTYKEQGRRAEIQQALAVLKAEFEGSELAVPADICWLYGSFLDDYLHDVEICQQFARRSREKMAELILERTGTTAAEAFHTIHNYIDTENKILRKGAVSAQKGELLLIPINMRDGSLICLGKGNADWNFSAPHDAGRLMSRAQAKQSFTVSEFKKQMANIYTTSVNRSTLDECPMAYKGMQDILNHIGPTVEVVKTIRPIYNFKVGEEE